MTLEEIRELAEEPRKNQKDLEIQMVNLKSKGCQILECIYYAKINQNCTLNEATKIVVYSKAWKNEKE